MNGDIIGKSGTVQTDFSAHEKRGEMHFPASHTFTLSLVDNTRHNAKQLITIHVKKLCLHLFLLLNTQSVIVENRLEILENKSTLILSVASMLKR